jgi:hypothetical protein
VFDGFEQSWSNRGPRVKVTAALEYYDSEIAKGRPKTRELINVAAEEAGIKPRTLEDALRERKKQQQRG